MLNLSVNDYIRIASVGGGLTLSAARISANDLVRIASVASASKARITIIDAEALSANDLVRIASVGQGVVAFV